MTLGSFRMDTNEKISQSTINNLKFRLFVYFVIRDFVQVLERFKARLGDNLLRFRSDKEEYR